MAISFEQFFSAISEQESGGNYNARGVYVKGDRAYGKYQVMGANIPSWTRQYFGKTLTPEQFLANPKAQEAVARGRLQSYWNKYGARGAAAAWYSGNASLHMSTRSQPGGPSIKGYVDSVLNKAAKYPSSGGGGANVTPAGGGGGGAPMAADEQAEQYGYVEALFNSVPELKALFGKATKGGWSAGKFQAELRDTKWWKTKPESVRKFLIKQYGDPASSKQELDQMYIKMTQMYEAMGGHTVGAVMRNYAMRALMNGWTDGQIRYELAKTIAIKGDTRPGEVGETYDKLNSMAYEMGVTLSDSWLDAASKDVVGGMGSTQEYEDRIRKMAKATFPQWAKQIDAGQSVADLASPYFQSMSGLLELPPGSINLFDPTIKKALQYKDPKTGGNSVKPLWQFENEIRSDNRWKSTKNAQDSVMQMAHQVLSDFGMAY